MAKVRNLSWGGQEVEEKELMKQRRKTGLHVMYTLTVQNGSFLIKREVFGE